MTPQRTIARLVPLGTAVLAFAIVWPVLAAPGMPLFQHDWIWSPFAAHEVSTWQLLLSTWRETSLGEPNSAISMNPLAWLKVLSALIASGRVSLELYLFVSVWVAVGGAYDIARRALHAPVATAFASATLFAATPALFDKIASGQSSYWAATAAFTWGMSWYLTFLETRTVRDASRACALFALATVQLHFLVFAWLAYAAGAAVSRSTRVAWLSAAGAIGASSLAIPELWFLAVRGPELGAGISPEYRYWVDAQSSSPADAFAMLGYAARYAERAIGNAPLLSAVHVAAYVAFVLAIAGVTRVRTSATGVFAITGVFGLVAMMGSMGPAGSLLTALALDTSVASFFREYYHAAILYALALSMLAPQALVRFPTRFAGAASAAPYAVSLVLGLAVVRGGLGTVLSFAGTPQYGNALHDALLPQESRALFLPAQQPLEIANDTVGGNDGTDWIDAAHPSVYAFYLAPPVAAIEASLAAGRSAMAHDVVPRLGISAIVDRAAVTSGAYARATAVRETSRALAAAFGTPRLLPGDASLFAANALPRIGAIAALRPLAPGLSTERDPSMTYIDEPGDDAAAAASGLERELPNVRSGWISRRDAPTYEAANAPAGAYGIVTARPGAIVTLRVRRSGAALVWAPDGIDVGGTTMRARLPQRVTLAAGTTLVRAHGTAVISEVGERIDTAEPVLAPSSVSDVRHVFPWSYRLRLTANGLAGVALREGYDPAWRLSAPGLAIERHERADGYANVWLVRGNGRYDVAIEYGWQPLGVALLVLSTLAFIAVAVPGCYPSVSLRRPVPTRDASDAS